MVLKLKPHAETEMILKIEPEKPVLVRFFFLLYCWIRCQPQWDVRIQVVNIGNICIQPQIFENENYLSSI